MNIENLNQPVAKNVARIINDKGLKQKAVAERLNLPAQTFSDMLNGRRIIKVSDTLQISKVLGVEPQELFKTQNPYPKEATQK